jgi:hypothetical protein
MYYYLYKITNIRNNRYYVGIHKTENLLDGYMGSGKLIKAAIRKYGLDSFRKEILIFCNSYRELLDVERGFVNSLFVGKLSSYNLKLGGKGGFDYINNNNILKFKGRTHTKKTKKQIGEKLSAIFSQEVYKQYFAFRMLGNNYNPRIKLKGPEHPAYGKAKSFEHREKLSRALKLAYVRGFNSNSPVYKKGAEHPAFGCVWICNPSLGLTQKIKSNLLDGYLSLGWSRGRLFSPRGSKI